MTNEKITEFSKSILYTVLYLTLTMGTASLLLIFIFFFYGSMEIINLDLTESGKLVINSGLCILFFLQHSFMIRKRFRIFINDNIGELFHGAVYTIFSGIALILLMLFWQKSSHITATAPEFLHWILRGLFFLALVGFYSSVRSLGTFDIYGIRPILGALKNRKIKNNKDMPLSIKGPYRLIRHPLYFFCLIFLWSHPTITADRLLFNSLFTIWIFIGTFLEERDLIDKFGDIYSDYKKHVPMILPYRSVCSKWDNC